MVQKALSQLSAADELNCHSLLSPQPKRRTVPAYFHNGNAHPEGTAVSDKYEVSVTQLIGHISANTEGEDLMIKVATSE
jgi:hypothetical protein